MKWTNQPLKSKLQDSIVNELVQYGNDNDDYRKLKHFSWLIGTGLGQLSEIAWEPLQEPCVTICSPEQSRSGTRTVDRPISTHVL